MRHLVAAAVLVLTGAAHAGELFHRNSADVLILGEVHDNPAHHEFQEDAVAALKPRAVVFEMLTQDEAAHLADAVRTESVLIETMGGFHWSNIADYAGIMAASDAVIVGAALPRDAVRAAFSDGAALVFGSDAEAFGLNEPLPLEELSQRENMQFRAHCEAMPQTMMGGMVEAQRLRDASFARAVLEAVELYGKPVVLITGNGHARRDWGVPAYLSRVAPDLRVKSIGQGEGGAAPGGVFDDVRSAAIVERADPCGAFN